jgi:hypothetical protein
VKSINIIGGILQNPDYVKNLPYRRERINMYARSAVSAAAMVRESVTWIIEARPGQNTIGRNTTNTGGTSSTRVSVMYHAFTRKPIDVSVEAKSLGRVHCL